MVFPYCLGQNRVIAPNTTLHSICEKFPCWLPTLFHLQKTATDILILKCCVYLAYMHDELILQACLTTTFRYAHHVVQITKLNYRYNDFSSEVHNHQR